MTLLGSIKKILRKSRPGLIIMIPVFLGCETEGDIGLQYELESDADVRYIEYTLPATNIRIDSLRTDEEVSDNRILVGNYFDGLIGSVSAESYFSVRFSGGTLPNGVIETDFIYDSIRFAFSTYRSIPRNIPSIQSFSLYQLQDTLTSLVRLSNRSEPLGDFVASYEVNFERDTLTSNIEIPKEIGQQVFNLIQEDSTSLIFSQWPSFALVPNESSTSISEFLLTDDTTAFYMYVTDPNFEKVVGGDTTIIDSTFVAEFSFSSATSPHYTYLNRDNSVGLLNMSADKEKLDLSGGQTVIDPLGGVSTSFSVPELQSFFEDNDPIGNPIIINNVVLSFELEGSTTRDTLESFYAFFETNGDFFGSGLQVNPFKNLVMSDGAYLGAAAVAATSSLGDEKDEIILNPTLFFQTLYRNFYNTELLDNLGISEPGLFITDVTGEEYRTIDGFVLLSTTDITMERVILKENGIKLGIYYTEVNQ